MNEPEAFVLADRTLESVIAQISDDQWDAPVPKEFPRSDTDNVPTLREIVNYHAYDDAWVPDMLGRKTMDEAGRDKFDGDLLGEDPLASYHAIVDRACAAAEELDDFDRTPASLRRPGGITSVRWFPARAPRSAPRPRTR